jgi:histidinol-phosphate aminotransferase
MGADWPFRDDLVGAEPYGAPQIDVPIRLNTNENPYAPSQALADAIADAVREVALGLNRYPDREAYALRVDLAAYLEHDTGVHLPAEQVWAANGSNEVMHQIFTLAGGPGRRALGFDPTYSMYAQYARDTFTEYVTVGRNDDFTIDPAMAVAAVADLEPDLVILTSPNNPTGTAVPLDVVEAVCEAASGLVVVDEAYAEFRRPGTPSAVTLLAGQPRLVVTRTMSKAFALAGGRLGYAAASGGIVDGLRIVRLPYHLSAVTQAVARTALEYSDELLARVAELRAERDALVDWLRENGFDAVDSDANFIMFGRFADSHATWSALLTHGVLVREVGPPGWLRVTVGTPTENAAFRAALRQVSGASGMIDAVPTAGGTA